MTKVHFAVAYVETSACRNVQFVFQCHMCHISFLLKNYLTFFFFLIFKADSLKMQSDTREGEGQTGGLDTSRLPLGLQSAGPDLGSYHPGTTQTSAAGLVSQDSGAERKRHLSALFRQTCLRRLL